MSDPLFAYVDRWLDPSTSVYHIDIHARMEEQYEFRDEQAAFEWADELMSEFTISELEDMGWITVETTVTKLRS